MRAYCIYQLCPPLQPYVLCWKPHKELESIQRSVQQHCHCHPTNVQRWHNASGYTEVHGGKRVLTNPFTSIILQG